MSEIQVNAIVSASGTEKSVTVGDITYTAENGYTSLEDAVASSDQPQIIVVDAVPYTGTGENSLVLRGATIIGVNGAAAVGNARPIETRTAADVITGMTFADNTGTSALNIYVDTDIDNSLFNGNVRGLYMDNSSAVANLRDTDFTANTNGGIYVATGTMSVTGGNFLNNRAGNGGAIYNHRGNVTVTDVYFSGNSVGNAGGAIRNDGRMTIGGATFVGNIGNQGAAIYNGGTLTIVDKLTLGASQTIRSEGTVYVKADSFLSPSAEGVQCALVVDGVGSSWREDRGSAQWITDDGYKLVTADERDLYVTDADADHIVANTTIVSVGGTAAVAAVGDTLYYGPQSASFGLGRKNTALVDFYYTGRAAVNYSADRTIVGSGDSGVRDSHQSGHGGALYFYKYTDVNYRIEGLNLINNTSTRGGAVMLEGGTLAVVNCVFSGNTCAGLGGALHKNNGILTISGSTFAGNTATNNGGAVMHDNDVQGVTISNSLFTGNRSAGSGGALYSRGGTISGSTFGNNYGTGGAIYHATSTLKISDTLFSGNTSGNGGAIVVNGGTVWVSGSTFSGNTATGYGGAISNSGVTYIDNCVFDRNRSGGYGAVFASGKYYVTNTTFQNNVSGAQGGVIRLNAGGTIHLAGVTARNNQGTGTFYIFGNGSSNSARVCIEGLVTLESGQNFRFDGSANDASNQFQVVGSSFFTGLGVAKAVNASANFGSWFVYNTNGVISASEGYKIFVLADSNNNDMYVTSADAMVTAAHSLVAVNNNPFTAYATLEAAQTAGVEKILLFDYTPAGDIAVSTDTALIGGGVSNIGGTITVTNDAALALGGDFTLTETLTIDGGAATLSNLNLSVAGELFSGTDAYTLISSIATPAAGDLTITLDGKVQAMDEWFDLDGSQYRFTITTAGALNAKRRVYDTVYAVLNGATEIVLDGQTITFAGREDVFTDIATAQSCLAADGTLIVVGQTAAQIEPGATTTVMVDSTITGYHESGSYYGIQTVEGQSSLSLRLVDSDFTNGQILIHGGSVTGDCSLELDNVSISNTDGRRFILGSAVGGDFNLTIRNSTLNKLPGTNDTTYLIRNNDPDFGIVGGTVRLTLENVNASGSITQCYGGSSGADICSGVVYTITDSAIGGNVTGAGGGGSAQIGGDVAITLTDSTVGGNVVGSRKNVVTGAISITLAGSTVGGAVRKQNEGETAVTSALTLTVTGAAASTIGGLSEVDNLVIDAGARAVFTTAQDLSSVALTVDAANYTGSAITVAGGVSAFDVYDVINGGSANLKLFSAGEDLILAEVSNEMSDGTTTNFLGGTMNLLSGGTVSNLFVGGYNLSDGSDVTSFITGGTIAQPVIGGALVKTGLSASRGTVTLDLRGGELPGGTQNGGMLYTAGYAYGAAGATGLPNAANYTVSHSVLNLAGATIRGNVYAGAHARKYAYTSVDATTITVSAGSVEKLYGGGWAEQGARSDVGTATVTISGGSIGRLYAGGGNGSNGANTNTATANLEISGGTVDFVFLGGKNNRCSVGNATLTITGSAQTLTRISGHNDCGIDNTTSSTLNVDTLVTLDYLDYVDRINISEGNLLHIVEDVIYTGGNDLAVNLETDGFDEVWTLLSARDTADIDTLAGARFYFNGGTTSYTMGDTVEIAGGSYTLNKSGLSIALSKVLS